MSDAAAQTRERHRALVADLTERAYEHAREFDRLAGEAVDLPYRKACFELFDTAFYGVRMGAALTERLTRSLERGPAEPGGEEERPRIAGGVAATPRSAEPEREREREPVSLETFLKSMEALDRNAQSFCRRGLGLPEPPSFIRLREALAAARTAVTRPVDVPPRESG
jgi:hypothetical protein